jgi:hypothetical protein
MHRSFVTPEKVCVRFSSHGGKRWSSTNHANRF